MEGREGARVLQQIGPVPEPSFPVEAQAALLAQAAQEVGIHQGAF